MCLISEEPQRIAQDKAPFQVRFREPYVFTHTKVCTEIFTNKCPYDAAPRSRTCPPRVRPAPSAAGPPPGHAEARGLLGKLRQRLHPGHRAGLPAPTRLGPSGPHPSTLRPARGECAAQPSPQRRRSGPGGRGARPLELPPPRRRRLPASAAPLPRRPLPRAPARSPARPAQAARVCFAARPPPPPPPPPPRASRAHLCLAGPHSSLPSVECLSRWLLRTVWLFPLVTAFTFCLNSSPRSRPSPARRLPPPPAACAPAPPPAAGAPPLATWGPAPCSPPPPSRRPSPAPSARWGYNCLSPPGGVILGVVGGGGGGGEEGNFLVPPFPGGGSGVGGHRFQI
nr:basic proline-rich protein-like [Chlorocebus sabaeus]